MYLRNQFFRQIALAVMVVILVACANAGGASAHAEISTSSPPAGGEVTALPPSLTLNFTEEVKPGAVSVQVTGPDGQRVDQGDARVSLDDPERSNVLVSLFVGGPGTYQVHWEAISNLDGDATEGDFSFTVTNAASIGSPVPGSTVVEATPDVVVTVTATPDDGRNGNPLVTSDDNFDSGAFLLSIGAGLLAAAAIVVVWFFVRPKNPKFGSRSRGTRD